MVVENKEIRLVASDLDGTLLDSEKRLPEGFLPLLEQLLARGVCFVAASGRQYFNMLEYFKTLGERIYFIAENGGVVYYRGRIVMARDMETELWQAVVADVAAKRAGRVILSGGKSAYAAAEDMKDENFARNVNRFFARATVVEKLEPASFDDGICKVAVFAENASETLTYPVLRHFSARANVVLSGPDWVDIMDLNVGKGGNRFLLYLGDLVRYRNISHFRWIVSELDEKLDLPFYMIPGNHEIADRFGSDNKYFYRMVFGPLYYWFSYGNVMFIGLDSSEERYDDAQLEWLEDVLEKVRPHFRYCVVYTHVPPLTDPSWRKQILTEPSVERLGRILQRHKIDLILAAHIHQYWRGSVWGIPVVTLMSSGQKIRSDVNKYGYVTVKVGKKGIEEIRPHYLADNMDDDNEYIELLFSNILVDDRFLVICLSVLGGGLLLLAAGVIGGRGR